MSTESPLNGSATMDDQSSLGRKRSTEDTAETTPPTGGKRKRSRYISNACNECKRRKIRCNGQSPCVRCGKLGLLCEFRDMIYSQQEFNDMKARIASLQEQVDTLFSNVNALRNPMSTVGSSPYSHEPARSTTFSRTSGRERSPSRTHSRTLPHPPKFQGPTSSAFSFDVARSSLQTMGITEAAESIEDPVMVANPTTLSPPPIPTEEYNYGTDPLWTIPRDEAVRLCRVYEEEIGIMYPMIDIEKIVAQVHLVYNSMEAAAKPGTVVGEEPEPLSENTIKMIIALALATEGGGESQLGDRLYDSVREDAERRLWGPVDIPTIVFLIMVSQYRFHTGEETIAWRTTGAVLHMCVEIGLHRRETLLKTITSEYDRQWTVKLFWSIVCLDRRWSFGTGMPFALEDQDIDPSMPEPDDSTPYLKAMLPFNRISSRVFRSVSNFENTSDLNKEEIAYIDWQILQWQQNNPDILKVGSSARGLEYESRKVRRTRVMVKLRVNQLRLLVYRPVLQTATSIMENRQMAQTVVDVAKDTIRFLTDVNRTSNIYRVQQVTFNYFLVSALAVLFLAVSHAPAQFSSSCRDEFYMALDIVKGFSTKSYTSQRLWKTIKGLKEVAPKLGLASRTSLLDHNDAHSTAAMAMAGLAGHSEDDITMYQQSQGVAPMGDAPINAYQMSYELSNWFEAAGHNLAFASQPQGELSASAEVFPLFGNEEELSRIMKDCF